MKKALVIVLALVLAFTFNACASGTNNQGTKTPGTTTPETTTPGTTSPGTTTPGTTTDGAENGALKDGTYTGAGDKWQFGNEDATVIVSEGKISQVTLRRLTTEGQEVNYEEWTGQEVQGQIRPNLKLFKQDMARAIIEKQSTDVDEIAGATISSKNWKLAVVRALEQAEVK